MADETNLSSKLSSKLPVADRTREVWGRKLYFWCLSSGFPLCTFLLGFADSFSFIWHIRSEKALTSARLRWFFFLHIQQLPFLWGLATLYDLVQSVPMTLLIWYFILDGSWLIITKTCLYNFDPIKPHFYIVKLGFTGVYIICLISAENIDCVYLLEPPRRGSSRRF